MADEWNVNRGVKLRELNGLGKALPGLEISLDKRAAAEPPQTKRPLKRRKAFGAM